jgi:hypothetical protein
LLCGGLSAAEFEACPARIDVQPQQLAKAAPGWTAAHAADAHHDLWYVTLYEGEPKEMASLVPDINGRQRQSWQLLPHPVRPYWLECHYTRTTIVLARPLAPTLKSCEVTFVPSETLDGHSVIKQVACR